MAKAVASRSASGWLDPTLKDQLLRLPTVRQRMEFLHSKGLIDLFGNTPYVSLNDRITVMAKIGAGARRSVEVPFYISTGLGGKANVPERKWYPFMGMGNNDGGDWFIKGTQEGINNNYGSKTLSSIKDILDVAIGDVDPWYIQDEMKSDPARRDTGYDWRKVSNPQTIEEAKRRLRNLNGRSVADITPDSFPKSSDLDSFVDTFAQEVESAAGNAPKARSVKWRDLSGEGSVSSTLGQKPVGAPAAAAADASDVTLSETLSNIRSRTTGFAGLGPKNPGPAVVTSEQVLPNDTIVKNAYLRSLDASLRKLGVDPDSPEPDPNEPGPARVRVGGKVVEGVGRVRLPNGSVIDLRTNQGRRLFKRVQEALKRRAGVEVQDVTNRAQGRGFRMGGPVPLLPGPVTPPPTRPPYPPLNRSAARMSINPLKPSGFMKYGKMGLRGLGVAGAGLLAGAFIKSKIDERREDEKRQLLLQRQARNDLIGLMGRREYKQSLEADIQRNLQSLQMKAPDLYMRVAAGRVLPQGAVVIGGVPRTDLLNELGMAMANGQFSQ